MSEPGTRGHARYSRASPSSNSSIHSWISATRWGIPIRSNNSRAFIHACLIQRTALLIVGVRIAHPLRSTELLLYRQRLPVHLLCPIQFATRLVDQAQVATVSRYPFQATERIGDCKRLAVHPLRTIQLAAFLMDQAQVADVSRYSFQVAERLGDCKPLAVHPHGPAHRVPDVKPKPYWVAMPPSQPSSSAIASAFKCISSARSTSPRSRCTKPRFPYCVATAPIQPSRSLSANALRSISSARSSSPRLR